MSPMSSRFTTSAARRRWRACGFYAAQQATGWPSRQREALRKDDQVREAPTRSLFERAIVLELANASLRGRGDLRVVALEKALAPVSSVELRAAMRALANEGVLVVSGNRVRLSRSLRRAVELRIISPV